MPDLLSLRNGPSTSSQIKRSFQNAILRDYELLILGNSKTYRGINPDMFRLKAYNFSHYNDSYNQIFFKMKYLAERKKEFKYLVLGVDYFQFSFISDTRNYLYGDYFEKEYMNDYTPSSVLVKKIEYYFSNINPRKLLAFFNEPVPPVLKDNGQYVKFGKGSESDTISRDATRLDFQLGYFERILDFCKTQNVKVFLVMLPLRKNEMKSYTETEIMKFDNFMKGFTRENSVYFLNYSSMDAFTANDYTDISHFNESAANRFSEMLSKDLDPFLH